MSSPLVVDVFNEDGHVRMYSPYSPGTAYMAYCLALDTALAANQFTSVEDPWSAETLAARIEHLREGDWSDEESRYLWATRLEQVGTHEVPRAPEHYVALASIPDAAHPGHRLWHLHVSGQDIDGDQWRGVAVDASNMAELAAAARQIHAGWSRGGPDDAMDHATGVAELTTEAESTFWNDMTAHSTQTFPPSPVPHDPTRWVRHTIATLDSPHVAAVAAASFPYPYKTVTPARPAAPAAPAAAGRGSWLTRGFGR